MYIKRKIKTEKLTHDDMDLIMLAFEDGYYFNLGALIANKIIEEFTKDNKRINFYLSIL